MHTASVVPSLHLILATCPSLQELIGTDKQVDRQTLVSSVYSCLRPFLEAEFCLGLGRKKHVRGLHTIFNIVEGGALVLQFG